MQRKFFQFGKLKLSYLDTETDSVHPAILITHANGFSAGCYSYILRHLGKKFRILALDFAGHGNSESTLEFKNWLFFRDQILALVEKENLSQIWGIGHSLGGASMLMASKLLKQKIEKIVLFDPTILNVPIILLGSIFGIPPAKKAKERRKDFRSIETVRKAFRRYPIFARWDEEIFEDYLHSCFRQLEEGVELACHPELEAKIFSSLSIFGPLAYLSISTESHIIIPQKYEVCSPSTARKIARGNSMSSVTIMPGFTHLFPFEEKKWVLDKLERIFQ